jgi:hypothetical protein
MHQPAFCEKRRDSPQDRQTPFTQGTALTKLFFRLKTRFWSLSLQSR